MPIKSFGKQILVLAACEGIGKTLARELLALPEAEVVYVNQEMSPEEIEKRLEPFRPPAKEFIIRDDIPLALATPFIEERRINPAKPTKSQRRVQERYLSKNIRKR